MITGLTGLFVGFIVGVVATYFVARNNRKYIDRALDADQELKARVEYAARRLKKGFDK